jgi:quercetin dioxygenase-like cupin family protein
MADMQKSFLVSPGAGEVLQPPEAGVGVVAKIWGEQTNGILSIVEHPVQPGALVPPHTHADLDEWSYVLEGVLGARVGDEVMEAPPGSYVLKPRAIPHTFWNAGPEPARIIELITPAGFERFFERLGRMFREGNMTPDALGALGAEYGTTYSMDWVPELEERYGVKLLGT